jgi:hypothetical protein
LRAARVGVHLTHASNGNNSLSPSKRVEGWGEGFVLVNISLLTPPLSSLKEAREKNGAGVKMRLKDCSLPAVVDWRFVRFLLRETDLILHF